MVGGQVSGRHQLEILWDRQGFDLGLVPWTDSAFLLSFPFLFLGSTEG
jgi:hypothetical protein